MALPPVWHVEASLESIRGNACLVVRRGDEPNYKFTKIKRLTSGITRFRCTNRKCNANIFLNQMEKIVRWNNFPHNHPGLEPADIALMKLKLLSKKKILEDYGSMGGFMKEVKKVEFAHVPVERIKLVRRCLYNVRKKAMLSQRHQMRESWEQDLRNADIMSDDAMLISDESHSSFDDEEMTKSCPHDSTDNCSDFAEPTNGYPPEQYWDSSPEIAEPSDEFRFSGSPTHYLNMTADLSEHVKSEPIDIKEEGVEVKEETFDWEEHISEKVCQSVQTDTDEDLEFFHSVLPMMKKLKNSDKSMVKAQIIQLMKWKSKDAV